MEASVDPQPRGPDWMPITPKAGSLFHADPRPFCQQCPRSAMFWPVSCSGPQSEPALSWPGLSGDEGTKPKLQPLTTAAKPKRNCSTRQDLLGHGQCGLGFDGRWPWRDGFLQRFDPARDEGAAPEAHSILADPERLSDLAAGPARESEHDRPRSVRFTPIPRTAERHQGTPLFFIRRDR